MGDGGVICGLLDLSSSKDSKCTILKCMDWESTSRGMSLFHRFTILLENDPHNARLLSMVSGLALPPFQSENAPTFIPLFRRRCSPLRSNTGLCPAFELPQTLNLLQHHL